MLVALLCIWGGAHGETQKPNDLLSGRTIPFEVAEAIENYKISGLWFPDAAADSAEVAAELKGPAIFVFKNIESGQQWTAAINAISLVDEKLWSTLRGADGDQLDAKTLVEKLREHGVIVISVPNEKRAKLTKCRGLLSSGFQNGGKAEKCLELGEALVNLQDIDFDGKREAVFRHDREGQRGGPAYEIFGVPETDDRFAARMLEEPYRELDWRSTLNVTRKQIIVSSSNGASDSTEETYSRDAWGKMQLTHLWTTGQACPSDNCGGEDYTVQDQLDGLGRCLKPTVRRRAEQ